MHARVALLATAVVVAIPALAIPAPAAGSPSVHSGHCARMDRLHVPGAEHQATACLDELTTAGTVASGHTVAADWAGLTSAALPQPRGVPGIQVDGYLVTTKDRVLVARHEPEISETTDVANHPEFAARKVTKTLDGVAVTGWFAEDFTLAELKTLRAKERIPQFRQHNTIYNGRYQVPTLQEVIDLTKRLSRELRRDIGIYPETKHPTYFRKLGLALEPRLVDVLNRNGLNRWGAKVYVQSFEVSNLKALRGQLRVPLVQLINSTGAPFDFVDTGDPRTYNDLVTPAGLAEIATYARGVGPAKDRIIPRDAGGFLTRPTTLVADAHRAGLKVHPWTFRAENTFVPADFRSSAIPAEYGNLFGELEVFTATGIDGLFTDNPDVAVAARTEARVAA